MNYLAPVKVLKVLELQNLNSKSSYLEELKFDQ